MHYCMVAETCPLAQEVQAPKKGGDMLLPGGSGAMLQGLVLARAHWLVIHIVVDSIVVQYSAHSALSSELQHRWTLVPTCGTYTLP